MLTVEEPVVNKTGQHFGNPPPHLEKMREHNYLSRRERCWSEKTVCFDQWRGSARADVVQTSRIAHSPSGNKRVAFSIIYEKERIRYAVRLFR